MNNACKIPLDLGNDLAYKIAKARAICDEVITHYCKYDNADPDSPKESDRIHAYDLCTHYKTWSILLHCAFDILHEAETMAENLSDKLDILQLELG